MIDKITPDTKVSEICEVISYIQGENVLPFCLHLYKDGTGSILDYEDEPICKIKDLNKYLKSIKKTDERDYDKILEDPAAVKKILQRLPLRDIISEIHERSSNNEILSTTRTIK